MLILSDAHKVLSEDVLRLQDVASDLFLRCERLRVDFQDQVWRAAQLISSIDSVTGSDEAPSANESEVYGAAKIEERLDKVKAKQKEITARYEAIRRKMATIGGADLSEKEAAFVGELQTMDSSLDRSAQTLSDDLDGSEVPAWQRLDKIKEIQKDLTNQVEQASRGTSDERGHGGMKVPSHSRKQETEHIDALLQRETALVEAATNRLRSLGIAIPLEAETRG
jgi:nucleoporin NUP82